MTLYVQRNVFDMQSAVEAGKAFDNEGREHLVITSSEKFIITSCEGEEHCFSHKGGQFAGFASTFLSLPSCMMDHLRTIVVYNEETLEPLEGFVSRTEAYTFMTRQLEAGVPVRIITNTSHPKHASLLRRLGLARVKRPEAG